MMHIKNVLELTLRDDFRELARAATEVGLFLESQPVSANLASGASLALEEILNNVIKYGYKNAKCHEFMVRVEAKNQEILIRCIDEGHKFNPRLSFCPKDADKTTEDQPENTGQGVYPALNVSYYLEYRHDRGKNILDMRITPYKP